MIGPMRIHSASIREEDERLRCAVQVEMKLLVHLHRNRHFLVDNRLNHSKFLLASCSTSWAVARAAASSAA